MLIWDGKEYRNIQEQVLKNAQDIEHYLQGQNVLNEFGIKVIGRVAEESDIPSVDAYKTAHDDWAYGDAYAVGTESPYALYILTRADDEEEPDDYWFDIGDFPLAGPQGPDGQPGSNILRVTASFTVPTFSTLSLSDIQVPTGYSVKAGDMLLGRYEGYVPGGGGLYTCFISSVSGTTVNVDGITNLMDDPSGGGGTTYSAGTGITISGTTISVDYDVTQPRIGLGTGLQWTTSNPQALEVNFSEVQATLSAGDGITISGNEIAVDSSIQPVSVTASTYVNTLTIGSDTYDLFNPDVPQITFNTTSGGVTVVGSTSSAEPDLTICRYSTGSYATGLLNLGRSDATNRTVTLEGAVQSKAGFFYITLYRTNNGSQSQQYVFNNTEFRPAISVDLGFDTYRWKNLYLSTDIIGTTSTHLSDGTTSVTIADIQTKSSLSTETWTFTLSGGTTVTKTIVVPA